MDHLHRFSPVVLAAVFSAIATAQITGTVTGTIKTASNSVITLPLPNGDLLTPGENLLVISKGTRLIREIQFNGQPTCATLTPDGAQVVMQLNSSAEFNQTSITTAVVNLATGLPSYYPTPNPQAPFPISGGGCAAMPNGKVLLGAALDSTATLAFGAAQPPKVVVFNPQTGIVEKYLDETPFAVTATGKFRILLKLRYCNGAQGMGGMNRRNYRHHQPRQSGGN